MYITEIVESIIKAGLIKFLPVIQLANRDYPYNDFLSDTTTEGYLGYNVGKNALEAKGGSKKLFVSKSMLIMCTTNMNLRLNDGDAVIHVLLANNWYEFKSNIFNIRYAYVTEEGTLYAHFEGVLPNEARTREA